MAYLEDFNYFSNRQYNTTPAKWYKYKYNKGVNPTTTVSDLGTTGQYYPQSCVVDRKGRVWIKCGTYKILCVKDNQILGVYEFNYSVNGNRLAFNFPMCIDNKGNICLSCNYTYNSISYSYLLKFDTKRLKFSDPYFIISGSLGNSYIYELCCDKDGIIWIGTSNQDLPLYKFNNNTVSVVNSCGNILYGGIGGLCCDINNNIYFSGRTNRTDILGAFL